MPPPSLPATQRCRHCGAGLTALQRQRGRFCDAAPCRWREAEQQAGERRDAAAARWRERARQRHGEAAAQAPVVWLRAYEPGLVALDSATRERHAAHLAAVAADPDPHRLNAELGYVDADEGAPPVDGALCGRCKGRCCQAGVGRHAFIDGEVLARQAARLGGTLADAVAHYLGRLPLQHVGGSCVYHGAQGCVLPRAERAPVCNGFACDSLRDAREAIARPGVAGLVVVELCGPDAGDAAWLGAPGGPCEPLEPLEPLEPD